MYAQSMLIYACTDMYVCAYVSVCMCVCMSTGHVYIINANICVYGACLCMHVLTCVCVCMVCAYTHVSVCMCKCVYICVHVCTGAWTDMQVKGLPIYTA